MSLPILQRLGLGRVPELLSKENRFLGVDIGSSSIKLVELRKEKERGVLETYGELSLAKYGNGETGRALRLVDKKIMEALGDLLKEANVKAKKTTVSIPLKDSFLTTVEMPELSESDLREAVPFEARKYIPVPVSEVILDWRLLPPKSKEMSSSSIGSGKKKVMDVLLVAVPKEIVAKYKSILETAGLEISALEIEVFSFARGALHRDLGSLLLVDLGASSTRMSIIDGGAVRASHSLDRGSQELSLAISQSLGVGFERAEILKRESGVLQKPETEGVVSILQPMIDLIASEAERFLLGWQRKGGQSPSKILVGGGGALLRGIEDFFIKRFGIEVIILNPFSKVVYPAFLEPTLKEIGATFTNAVGLALHDF